MSADPLPLVLEAWRERSPGANIRREQIREWWPSLGTALDALVDLAPVIPGQRRPGPDMEAAVVVACLVRRYGDRHPEHPGITSAMIQETDLTEVDARELTVLVDPSSGGMYIRHKGPPLEE